MILNNTTGCTLGQSTVGIKHSPEHIVSHTQSNASLQSL